MSSGLTSPRSTIVCTCCANSTCRAASITSIPLGSTSTTCPPSVVVRLELLALAPCAFNADAEFWFTRFCIALPECSVPISPEIPELALVAREFFTVPSVDAARFSDTTTEIRSCGRIARTSVDIRVSLPVSVQIAPVDDCAALFSSRTRVR